MDPAEVAQLLFHGGLSTSAAVSEFSGRGVGLDIVRATAKRSKETPVSQATPGRGTVVEISVPVSMESLTVLAVVDSGTDVLDSLQCHPPRPCGRAKKDLVPSATGAAIIVGDQAIPFQSLGRIVGPRSSSSSPGKSQSRPILVLEAGGARAAVGVDRFRKLRTVVIRPLPSLCGNVPLVAGATLNGMGNPELMLDATSLVAAVLAGSSATGQARRGTEADGARRRRFADDADARAERSRIGRVFGRDGKLGGRGAGKGAGETPFALHGRRRNARNERLRALAPLSGGRRA